MKKTRNKLKKLISSTIPILQFQTCLHFQVRMLFNYVLSCTNTGATDETVGVPN